MLVTSPRTRSAPPGATGPASPPADASSIPQLPGVAHKFVNVNGIRYHYAEAGSGEPLLLVHGFPQHWYMWRDLIPELSKRYRVIAPDMRGAGWTDAPERGYRKHELADELAAFMDAVGAPKARVMAHDWGGFVSFLLALRHPEKVEKYLAVDIATPWPDARSARESWRLLYQPVLAAPVLGAQLLKRPSFLGPFMRSLTTRTAWSPEELATFTERYRDPARAQAGSELYRSFLLHEALPLVLGQYDDVRLEPETLLIAGEHDPVVKEGLMGDLAGHSRDARVEIVPDAGHFLPEERPDVLLERALDFFD